MAAVAFPVEYSPARRPVSPGRRRRRSKGPAHLRLVEAPLFDEPIFEELREDQEALAEEWSVWRRPMPVIPRHQFVTDLPHLELPEPYAAPSVRVVPIPEPKRSSESVGILSGSQRPAAAPHFALRRLIACVLLGCVMFGAFSGVGAISGAHQGSPVVLTGSVAVNGGYEYTVRSGDTLWSIASRVYPNGDPRALVSQLESQLHGALPVAGERLLLP